MKKASITPHPQTVSDDLPVKMTELTFGRLCRNHVVAVFKKILPPHEMKHAIEKPYSLLLEYRSNAMTIAVENQNKWSAVFTHAPQGVHHDARHRLVFKTERYLATKTVQWVQTVLDEPSNDPLVIKEKREAILKQMKEFQEAVGSGHVHIEFAY